MNNSLIILPLLFSILFSSCASYRVVQLSRGVDASGNIQTFYGIAQNNVIIPEYTINERGEYPTAKEEANARFVERKKLLEPEIKKKYIVPGNAGYSVTHFISGFAFLVISPISYPMFYFSSHSNDRSFGKYMDVMVHGSEAKQPKLRDEFSNF